MTPTCHKRTEHRTSTSTASTAFPSEQNSLLHSEENSDDEDEGDCDEACAELIGQLEAGGEARQAAIEALLGSVDDLSFDAAACRVVQKALELADPTEVTSLASELNGRVQEAIRSPHANHVIQKIVEVLPTAENGFLIEELLGAALEFARHRYGCRVLVKLVERNQCCPDRVAALIDEVLVDAADLVRHTWGHYVIEAVLQFGDENQKSTICEALCKELFRNAKNRCATYVVERAFACCSHDDVQSMLSILTGSADSLVSLVENQFGCHVAKSLMKLPLLTREHALTHLEAAAPKLQTSKYGRRVLEEYRRSVQ
jgi:pumilio RNA-binding family